MPQVNGGYEPHATTMDCSDKTFDVDLYYPRARVTQTIKVGLLDVRAANDIHIQYDFERDGWVILSDLVDPDNPPNLDEYRPPLKEVSFIPAWPQKGETDGCFSRR